MRLTGFALAGLAACLASCASGGGRAGSASYYQQTAGPAGRSFSGQNAAPPTASDSERQSVTQAQQALLGAINEVDRSVGGLAGSFRQLKGGLGGRANGVFAPSITTGTEHLQWIRRALGDAATLANAALAADELGMERGLLRLSGPRLQAAMSGVTLLAAWLDFLNLADAVLQQCPAYGVERLFVDMNRVQQLIGPAMKALASLEPEQVEATAAGMPELMGQLTGQFQSIRENARVANERIGQLMVAAQLMEMFTMASAMKLSLPRLPPAAPATLGVGLVMGSNGVLLGSRLVVSAEWVERMRQLVQAGVLSVPAISAAVRIQAGQVMMAQASQDLPQGVREALGDGPEVSAMRETGRAGAGMAESPQHHVMPREHREWFEKRGFTGAMDIDQFCVELETAHHQAVHGGGNWGLGRQWPGEWNRMIMEALREAEITAGRMLSRNAILKIVAKNMRDYGIPMNFTPWRGR